MICVVLQLSSGVCLLNLSGCLTLSSPPPSSNGVCVCVPPQMMGCVCVSMTRGCMIHSALLNIVLCVQLNARVTVSVSDVQPSALSCCASAYTTYVVCLCVCLCAYECWCQSVSTFEPSALSCRGLRSSPLHSPDLLLLPLSLGATPFSPINITQIILSINSN